MEDYTERKLNICNNRRAIVNNGWRHAFWLLLGIKFGAYIAGKINHDHSNYYERIDLFEAGKQLQRIDYIIMKKEWRMKEEKVVEKKMKLRQQDEHEAESDDDIHNPKKLYLLILTLDMGIWGTFSLKQT